MDYVFVFSFQHDWTQVYLFLFSIPNDKLWWKQMDKMKKYKTKKQRSFTATITIALMEAIKPELIDSFDAYTL